jgi:hypothetical protein
VPTIVFSPLLEADVLAIARGEPPLWVVPELSALRGIGSQESGIGAAQRSR